MNLYGRSIIVRRLGTLGVLHQFIQSAGNSLLTLEDELSALLRHLILDSHQAAEAGAVNAAHVRQVDDKGSVSLRQIAAQSFPQHQRIGNVEIACKLQCYLAFGYSDFLHDFNQPPLRISSRA